MGFVTKEKLFSKDFFITYGWLLGGCFVFALGAVLFAEPYGFAPGGTYGLSMVFHHLWGWETEIAALCMDLPLLLLGIYFLGGMFGVKTIICTFAIPAFMRLIHYVYGYDALLEPGITDRTMLNEQLLSAIFGGIVYGIGIGMIFKARATSGGSDIISMILNKYTHLALYRPNSAPDSGVEGSSASTFFSSTEQYLLAGGRNDAPPLMVVYLTVFSARTRLSSMRAFTSWT